MEPFSFPMPDSGRWLTYPDAATGKTRTAVLLEPFPEQKQQPYEYRLALPVVPVIRDPQGTVFVLDQPISGTDGINGHNLHLLA